MSDVEVLERPEPPTAESTSEATPEETKEQCALPPQAERILPPDLDPQRVRAIVMNEFRWVNGTVLHYFFFDSPEATGTQREAVRKAFARWKNEGIGLSFVEVDVMEEAELRISFSDDRRSWSYIGTYNLKIHRPEPTMHFGWELTTEWGRATALHEIGHALGMPHEHQNPLAGIVWDEDRVYTLYERTQGWDRPTINYNVLRKLPVKEVTNTPWDPTSIMHYPIAVGLIKEPKAYALTGTPKNTALSPSDIAFIRDQYPADGAPEKQLRPMTLEPLSLRAGGQADFVIQPSETRTYHFQTVGSADAKLVLFERREGEPRFLAGDDDSATPRNASIDVRLVRNHIYVLRTLLYCPTGPEGFGVMMV